MKTCPICNAVCFDDMDTCFGCLHRFDDASTNQGAPIATPDSVFDSPSESKPTVQALLEPDDSMRISVLADGVTPQTIKRITVEIGFPLDERKEAAATV